jgi:hypothetical protein
MDTASRISILSSAGVLWPVGDRSVLVYPRADLHEIQQRLKRYLGIAGSSGVGFDMRYADKLFGVF